MRRGPRRFILDDPADDLLPVVALEGRPKREKLVQRDAQRVDVGAGVDQARTPAGLLGTHVLQRSRHVAGLGQACLLGQAGQSEIGDP